jgi:hypothetical protein
MSNKKTKSLLSEAAVRRFMKLAELDNVTSDSFVSDLFFEEEEMEDAEAGPMDAGGEMTIDMGEPAGDELPPGPEGDMGAEDPGAGMAPPEVSPEVADAVAASIMSKVGEVLADELGADVEVVSDEGEMGGMDAPMDAAPPEDEGADPVGEPPVADMGDVGDEPAEDVMQEEETEGPQGGDLNDDLVNEVARRVAARLMARTK